jgi:hypothetical protein
MNKEMLIEEWERSKTLKALHASSDVRVFLFSPLSLCPHSFLGFFLKATKDVDGS